MDIALYQYPIPNIKIYQLFLDDCLGFTEGFIQLALGSVLRILQRLFW